MGGAGDAHGLRGAEKGGRSARDTDGTTVEGIPAFLFIVKTKYRVKKWNGHVSYHRWSEKGKYSR